MLILYGRSPISLNSLGAALLIHAGDHPVKVLVLPKDEGLAKKLLSDGNEEAEMSGTPVELLWILNLDYTTFANMTTSSSCGILIFPAVRDYWRR